MPFEQWLLQHFPSSTMDYYCIDGKIAVDHVIQYANLEADLTNTLERLGIMNIPPLTNAKGSFRPKKRDYKETHTPATKAHVEKTCWKEIKAFDYKF